MTDTANAPERIKAWMQPYFSEIGSWSTTRYPEVTIEYVLATHCDELVAAAYLDAGWRIEQCLWPYHWYLDGESVDPEDLSRGILKLTPDNARAALTAYGERMKAEGALEAQAKIARMEASLEILRDNPAAVHLNMLKGNIAKPTWEQIKHLYRAEFNLLQENANE